MAAYAWAIDAATVPLALNDGVNTFVTEQDVSPPPLKAQFQSTVDTEGAALISVGHENRRIMLKVRVVDSTDSALEDRVQALQMAVGKLNREGGTLGLTTPAGTLVTFTVLTAQVTPPLDRRYMVRQVAEVTLEFECRPYGYGTETDLGSNSETTLPVLIFTDVDVPGDVPALGRLVVDEADADNQHSVIVGLRSRYYSPALTAQLFYQAESLTLQGAGAATSTAAAGYSGSGSVLANALTGAFLSIVSTQMTTAALTSVTGESDTEVFTKTSHGLTNETAVTLSSLSGGTGLSTSTTYYVIAAAANTFQLALAPAGAAVDFTTDVSSVTVTPATHLSHIGTYRAYARVFQPTANTGTVSVALEWGVGDFRRFTQNTTVELATTIRGAWQMIDLGLVRIPSVLTGTQRWEGRVLAKSTVTGDDIQLDWLMLQPVDEFAGVASAVLRAPSPTTHTLQDGFDQSAGALTGKTLPTGGTWEGAGDADDFSASGSSTATRVAISDATGIENGRFVVASTGSIGAVTASVKIQHSAVAQGYSGLLLRYTDVNNFLAFYTCVSATAGVGGFFLTQRVASVNTTLLAYYSDTSAFTAVSAPLYATVLADGTWSLAAVSSTPVASGYSSALATGGALATGKVGMYDQHIYATACTRTFNTFYAYAGAADAAMFASQSIAFRHDGVIREDSTGGYWNPVSRYEGDMLYVPCEGREQRTVQVLVKGTRGEIGVGSDSGIDDVSARLYATPRFLTVPT